MALFSPTGRAPAHPGASTTLCEFGLRALGDLLWALGKGCDAVSWVQQTLSTPCRFDGMLLHAAPHVLHHRPRQPPGDGGQQRSVVTQTHRHRAREREHPLRITHRRQHVVHSNAAPSAIRRPMHEGQQPRDWMPSPSRSSGTARCAAQDRVVLRRPLRPRVIARGGPRGRVTAARRMPGTPAARSSGAGLVASWTATAGSPTQCSGDGECDGHCVNGRCSAEFGTCQAPAA